MLTRHFCRVSFRLWWVRFAHSWASNRIPTSSWSSTSYSINFFSTIGGEVCLLHNHYDVIIASHCRYFFPGSVLLHMDSDEASTEPIEHEVEFFNIMEVSSLSTRSCSWQWPPYVYTVHDIVQRLSGWLSKMFESHSTHAQKYLAIFNVLPIQNHFQIQTCAQQWTWQRTWKPLYSLIPCWLLLVLAPCDIACFVWIFSFLVFRSLATHFYVLISLCLSRISPTSKPSTPNTNSIQRYVGHPPAGDHPTQAS